MIRAIRRLAWYVREGYEGARVGLAWGLMFRDVARAARRGEHEDP